MPHRMRIWALSDLHLSLGGDKPMDVFGAHWRDHHLRMAEAWDAVVAADDIVLSPGDLSWAGKPAEAAADLAWLGARPGRKILVKGNHDHWWPKSRVKLESLLPPRTWALKKTACRIDGIGFFGARGGDFAPLTRYGDTRTPADIAEALVKEQRELEASIAHLDALDAEAGTGRGQRICLFHYPPLPPAGAPGPFASLIAAAGATLCVYGHLHGTEVDPDRIEGRIGGVDYRCMSCDQIGFAPRLLLEF